MFVVSSLVFIALFYGICIYGVMCDGGKDRIKKLVSQFSLKYTAIVIGAFIIFALFVIYWAKSNQYIYFWDLSGYWSLSIDRTNYMMNNSFVDIVRSLFNSINNDDYNIFLPTIIALPFSIIGNSFARYVFLVCMMFLVPTIVVQGLLTTKIIVYTDKCIYKSFVLGILIAFIMPANYYAVFRGYIDVAFLLPMSVIIYLFIDYDFRKISVSRNISIALLLVLSWISRRYTVFFIIGFVVAMIIKAVFVLLEDKRLDNLKQIVANFFIIGGISLGILLIFFRKFFLHALLTNYGKMYSAYDEPLLEKIMCLKAAFGIFSALIILTVGLMCFKYKRNRVNYISLILMVVVEMFSFWMTQNMGTQHRMILNVPIYVLLIMVFDFGTKKENTEASKNKGDFVRRAVILLCSLTMVINFAKAFVPILSTNGTTALFSERYYPLRRGDLDQIHKLVERLNELTVGTDDWIYVAASGDVLNCEILMRADMPDKKNAVNNLYYTHDVDLRDGFPTVFLYAKYVVTTSPVQLHLSSGQEVVSYLANGIQDNKSFISHHYEKINEYELDNDVVAKIYEKVSDYSEDDLQQIRNYFGSLYPNSTDIFEKRIYMQ